MAFMKSVSSVRAVTPLRLAIAAMVRGASMLSFHHAHRGREPRVVLVEAAERDQRLRVGARVGLLVDEDAGDIEGRRHAVAHAYQMQHEVEGRRGAARGEGVGVDDVAVGNDLDVREGGGEILEVFPVGRHAPSLQQAGAGEQPGARFDAAGHGRGRRGPADLRKKHAPVDGRGAEAGNHGEDVGAPGGIEAFARNRHAAGSGNGCAIGRDQPPAEDLALLDPVGGAQRIDRGGDRHDRRARQDEEGDVQARAGGIEDGGGFVMCHLHFVNRAASARKCGMIR